MSRSPKVWAVSSCGSRVIRKIRCVIVNPISSDFGFWNHCCSLGFIFVGMFIVLFFLLLL